LSKNNLISTFDWLQFSFIRPVAFKLYFSTIAEAKPATINPIASSVSENLLKKLYKIPLLTN
jgi:hypothetical protein